MSANTFPACPLALTADDLSRFRDGDAPPGQERVIQDHLASCAVCRARLAEYDHIGTGLRDIPEPMLDGDRFWREVEARMGGRRLGSIAGRARLRYTFSGLGAVAAVLLVAIAFAQLFASHGRPMTTSTATAVTSPTATLQPSPTVAPARSVTWKQLSFPSAWDQPGGSGAPYTSATLGFTAADANTIYACDSHFDGASATYTIWTSRDRGATWAQVGSVPSHQPAQCKVIVDSTDARNAIVRLSWYEPGAAPTAPSGLTYVTGDAGHTFTALPGNYDYAQMAGYHGKVYILRLDAPGDPNQSFHLMVSSDGMHTWGQLDQTFAGSSAVVSAFWLNPATGSILVYAFSGSDRSFWVSVDSGASWQRLSDPGSGLARNIAVQWPVGNEPWRLCVAGQPLDVAPADQHNQLWCTLDGGKTWATRPALDVTLTCNCLKGRPFTSISALNLVGIAPDGSLLATVLDRYDGDNPHLGLYRLAPNASAWNSIGDASAADLSANNTTFLLPSGVLWTSGQQLLNQASFWTQAAYVSTATYP